MRKKCVRWTKSVRTALVVAAAIITALVAAPVAQTTDPSAQPKLTFADLSYVGGFRLPAASSNGDTFSFGGKQLTFNPISNSLFIGSRAGRVAEISIPAPVNTGDPNAMPFATYLQPFADPTEGHLAEITGEGVGLDSFMVYGNRLYGTASVYYDANNTQQVSHYSRSLQLNEPSFSGWSSVWDASKTGFVSGSMSVVPTEWRTALGGAAATGQCCIPVVWRTSWGPSAFAFDPEKIGQSGVVPASPLLYYTGAHPTLGQWDNANPTYGSTIQMGGMAIIAGTRTVLYFGRNGTGPNCYGNGTGDKSLEGQPSPDGSHWCYDPTNSDKGSHAYPYRYQIWAYDLNDMADVKAGRKQPWEVVPYGVWPFDFPTAETSVRIGGVGYDAVNQLLYISQLSADRDGYSYRPVIHVLQINAAPGSNEPLPSEPVQHQPSPTTPAATVPTPAVPAPTTPNPAAPAPSTNSNVVSAITMSVNHPAPQLAGTAITFSAFATGGVTPQEYKWLVDDGTGLQAVTDWSVIDTFTWTPAAGNAHYRVGVWARSHGNTGDAPEASASARFPITALPSVPLRSVDLSPDKPAPQEHGGSVKWTAVVSGGNAVEYKWLVHDGGSWSAVTGWTAQNTFTWTPATANLSYRVGVWARNASTTDQPDVTSSADFPVKPSTAVAVPSVTVAVPSETVASPSGPMVRVTTTTVQPGALIPFTVIGGPANKSDWVSLSQASAPDNIYLDWMYLNGLTTATSNGLSSATLQFTAPVTPGTYNVRLFGRSKLATSATITVGATAASVPAVTVPTTSGPAVSVAATMVQAGAVIQFAVSGGPANRSDWVSLAHASDPDNRYLEWMYLNGLTTVPSSGRSLASGQFTAPSIPGTYNVRFFAKGLLATSATITVQ